MIQPSIPLILASGSPRRRELLDQMGLIYMTDVSDADETFSGSPEDTVLELSKRKAEVIADKHPDSVILAADTVVCCGEVLGKPHSSERAAEMLRMLSGNWHEVYTGVTLLSTASGQRISRSDRTRVHFVPLSEAEIERYSKTDEPLDKAGGYAIQGEAGMFIDRIEGSYSNVIGLPMALLRTMLIEMNRGVL